MSGEILLLRMANPCFRVTVSPYRQGTIRVMLMTAYGVLVREAITPRKAMADIVADHVSKSLDPDATMKAFAHHGRVDGRRIILE